MKRLFVRPLGACALALGLLGGCSLLVDVDDECTADADCGGELRCVQNLCVATGVTVAPTECAHYYGVPEDQIFADDVVRVGMLMPTTGDLGPVGLAIERAAALAVEQINESSGIDGRRIGIIACDTATNLDQAKRLADWLIKGARVPAIIGPATSANALGVFTDVARPNGTLIISPSATSPAITDLDDDDLLWRTVPSDAAQGRAILAYLADREYDKIAMIHLDDPYGRGLRDAVQFPLCEQERCGEANFLALPYRADNDGVVSLDTVTQIKGQLRDFAPEVIVFVGFVQAGIAILGDLASSGYADLPFVLTDGLRNDELIAGIGNETLLGNVLGTAAASPDGAVYQVFANAYRAKYGEDPGVYNAQAYDAMYLIAFAMAGAQGQLTGGALAAQLKRMSAGETVLARGDDWTKGVRILRGSPDATFDFSGTSGALDFNPDTGEALANIEGWYFDVMNDTVESYGVIYTEDGTYRAPMSPDMTE
ncbi:MAG: ABC transporter substrate-binding protein [bacterium]|nr:ABC transporter substrate-binding protein [Myxococcales bacterium]MCB9541134.1 ABC transporter substrate-binding protein [Myxococcales bacterium]MCB9551693.1 ABC transporter substrate-binding protein [Myxococcales bacterium]